MTTFLVVVAVAAWLTFGLACVTVAVNRRNAKRAARLPKQTSGPCGAE